MLGWLRVCVLENLKVPNLSGYFMIICLGSSVTFLGTGGIMCEGEDVGE